MNTRVIDSHPLECQKARLLATPSSLWTANLKITSIIYLHLKWSLSKNKSWTLRNDNISLFWSGQKMLRSRENITIIFARKNLCVLLTLPLSPAGQNILSIYWCHQNHLQILRIWISMSQTGEQVLVWEVIHHYAGTCWKQLVGGSTWLPTFFWYSTGYTHQWVHYQFFHLLFTSLIVLYKLRLCSTHLCVHSFQWGPSTEAGYTQWMHKSGCIPQLLQWSPFTVSSKAF